MAIPKDFVKDNFEKSKGSTFFGVPVEEMTREELIACCVSRWRGQEEQRQEYARRLV